MMIDYNEYIKELQEAITLQEKADERLRKAIKNLNKAISAVTNKVDRNKLKRAKETAQRQLRQSKVFRIAIKETIIQTNLNAKREAKRNAKLSNVPVKITGTKEKGFTIEIDESVTKPMRTPTPLDGLWFNQNGDINYGMSSSIFNNILDLVDNEKPLGYWLDIVKRYVKIVGSYASGKDWASTYFDNSSYYEDEGLNVFQTDFARGTEILKRWEKALIEYERDEAEGFGN